MTEGLISSFWRVGGDVVGVGDLGGNLAALVRRRVGGRRTRRRRLCGVGNKQDDPAEDYRVEPDRLGELLSLEAGNVDVEIPHLVPQIPDLSREHAGMLGRPVG